MEDFIIVSPPATPPNTPTPKPARSTLHKSASAHIEPGCYEILTIIYQKIRRNIVCL